MSVLNLLKRESRLSSLPSTIDAVGLDDNERGAGGMNGAFPIVTWRGAAVVVWITGGCGSSTGSEKGRAVTVDCLVLPDLSVPSGIVLAAATNSSSTVLPKGARVGLGAIISRKVWEQSN